MNAEPVPQPDRRRWLLGSAAAALLPPRALAGEAPSLALLRRRLPVVCRHEGVWEGVYRRYDAAGKPLGEHRSRVVIRLRDDPKGGADLLHQTNHYYHPDGRRESLETYGSFDGERLNFRSDRVDGWTMDDGTDPKRNTVILGMTFKKDAGWYRKGVDVYEIINIATDGRHRARMAQHLQDGQALSRTLIDERLRTRDWRAEADWQAVPFGDGA